MQNLLEKILEKNSKIHGVDPELIKKILEMEQEFFSTDSKVKLSRQNNLVSLLKDNLKE
tara:strand:+ start:3031 stop:3207 length:177 start_codon:yes stop_codon:yes gene_type:complete